MHPRTRLWHLSIAMICGGCGVWLLLIFRGGFAVMGATADLETLTRTFFAGETPESLLTRLFTSARSVNSRQVRLANLMLLLLAGVPRHKGLEKRLKLNQRVVRLGAKKKVFWYDLASLAFDLATISQGGSRELGAVPEGGVVSCRCRGKVVELAKCTCQRKTLRPVSLSNEEKGMLAWEVYRTLVPALNDGWGAQK